MAFEEEYVEWDEPAQSTENYEFYMSFKQYVRLLRTSLVPKMLAISVGVVVIMFVIDISTKHRNPLKMAVIIGGFFLGVALMAVATALLFYIPMRSVRRHVRVSRIDVRYSILAQKRCYSFADIKRVLIEPVDNGDYRLVLSGTKGELCRLHVAAKVNIASIVRLIPQDKVVWHHQV